MYASEKNALSCIHYDFYKRRQLEFISNGSRRSTKKKKKTLAWTDTCIKAALTWHDHEHSAMDQHKQQRTIEVLGDYVSLFSLTAFCLSVTWWQKSWSIWAASHCKRRKGWPETLDPGTQHDLPGPARDLWHPATRHRWSRAHTPGKTEASIALPTGQKRLVSSWC